MFVRGKCECLCCSLQDPAAPPPSPRSAAGCSSQNGRTYIRSPSSSAILHPSTTGRQPVGDRMGSGASGTPAGDRRGNERAKKRGQHVIRRITARSIAHPLRSATPLTGALKAYKIGTRPKSPSTSGISLAFRTGCSQSVVMHTYVAADFRIRDLWGCQHF